MNLSKLRRLEGMRLYYFYPLFGYVVQTVVVSYGFVIPSSCIAGVNKLTVAFGCNLLGVCLTYFLGVCVMLSPAKNAGPLLKAEGTQVVEADNVL
jgi:hypothetical protein